MTSWVRLWHDMPTDPKFRTIARASQQPIHLVVSVFTFMLCDASNATERGRTLATDEDIASAFDVTDDAISSIRGAMQGRVLDGDRLTGWDARQPKREDNSADRAKQWRSERNRTQPNAQKRPDTDTDTEINNPIVPAGTVPRKRRGMNGFDPETYAEFEEGVWNDFPRHPNSRKHPAFVAYEKLPVELRAKCIGGVLRYAERFREDDEKGRSEAERLRFVPHLTTWISQKGWESEYDRQG